MLNVYPSNNSRQEQTHFFTRNVNTFHHDCPFCNQQFQFTQSQFTQNAASLSKSGFHHGPPIMTNPNICDNPTCVVCGRGSPKVIEAEEIYEYQRNLPAPCEICGDQSFVQGMAPFNTLTLRSSQFVGTAPSYMSRSMGPVNEIYDQAYIQQERIKNYYKPMTSRSTMFQQEQRSQENINKTITSRKNVLQVPSVGERISIRTPKEEYQDVNSIIFNIFY